MHKHFLNAAFVAIFYASQAGAMDITYECPDGTVQSTYCPTGEELAAKSKPQPSDSGEASASRKHRISIIQFQPGAEFSDRIPSVTPSTYTVTGVAQGGNGRIKRSDAAKNAFKLDHPCPANGHRAGPCPGYVIDHIQPLACGGEDAPGNMQWQTEAEGKAKDQWERVGCEARHRSRRAVYSESSSYRLPEYDAPAYAPDYPGDGSGQAVYVGPRGGRYVISSGGKKRYLPRE